MTTPDEPAEPARPAEPNERLQPVEPDAPAEPNERLQPVEPDAPAEPNERLQPVEANVPVEHPHGALEHGVEVSGDTHGDPPGDVPADAHADDAHGGVQGEAPDDAPGVLAARSARRGAPEPGDPLPGNDAAAGGAPPVVAGAVPPAEPAVAASMRDQPPSWTTVRRRRSLAQRALLVLNCLVITACFVGAGALLTARHYANNIHKVDLQDASARASPAVAATAPDGAATTDGTTPLTAVEPAPVLPGETLPSVTGSTGPPETFPAADPTAKNFLITGADNNACIDPASPFAGAFGDREAMGERSDTVMVMRVDPANTRAAILSFPRDLWVQIAGRGSKNRINSAFVKNDPRKLIDTILLNFRIGIDHYIQVDFCAFKQLVDAVGGVSVPFTFAARDENTGLNVPVGGGACFTFEGDHALAYVRSRHYEYQREDGTWQEDPASDLGRVSRQQDFIRRALDAALDKGVYNPSVARGLIDIATQSIVVDNLLTIEKMLEFFGVLRNFQPGTIRTYQIEAESQNVSGNSVLIPRLDGENMQSILRIFQGIAPLAGAPEQVFETTIAPETSATSAGDAGGDATASPTATGPDSAASPDPPTPASSAAPAPDAASVPAADPALDPAAPTTVVDEGPVENVKGIVPPTDVTC